MTEDVPTAGSEAAGRSEVDLIDRLHSEHRVERGNVQRGQRSEKDDRGLVAAEHQDRERHPSQNRDRPQRFQDRESVVAERTRPAHNQSERNADRSRDAERNEDATTADVDVLVVLRGEDRDALLRVGRQPLAQDGDRPRNLHEAGQLQALTQQPVHEDPEQNAECHQVGRRRSSRLRQQIPCAREPIRCGPGGNLKLTWRDNLMHRLAPVAAITRAWMLGGCSSRGSGRTKRPTHTRLAPFPESYCGTRVRARRSHAANETARLAAI